MLRNRGRRLDEILSRVRMHHSTTIEDLADQFSVSTATIRRDIKLLEQQGAVVQTVGGGVLFRNPGSGSVGADPRVSFIEEKIRIAEYCTELVEEHDEILIGPGTTAFLIGRILTGVTDRKFRIITNSLELAMEASATENVQSVVLGGEVYARHSAGYTEHDDFFSTCHRKHRVILSADGIDPDHGITLFDPRFLNVLRKMIAVSKQVILAADSSKIGKVCFNKIADLQEVSLFVTDINLNTEFGQRAADLGVPVVKV